MSHDIEIFSVDGEIRAVPVTPLGIRFFLQTNGQKAEENAALPEYYRLDCDADDFAEAARSWNLCVLFDGQEMVKKILVH